MKGWFLYVVCCSDSTLYTGVTNCVERRVRQHNGELAGGAKYTRARRPVRLMAQWACESRSDALRREHKFKELTRKEKLERISNDREDDL